MPRTIFVDATEVNGRGAAVGCRYSVTMLEPSSGRATTSGPGTPLLAGIAGAALLLIAFLIGYQLGTGGEQVRTIVIGASGSPGLASASPEPQPPVGLIQPPQVADELQQGYYANATLRGWVICESAAALTCDRLRPVPLDPDHLFDPPARHWDSVAHAPVERGSRIYLIGDVVNLDRVWVGLLEPRQSRTWRRVIGVTLNASIQYVDLGALPPGDYVVLSTSADRSTSLGAGLRVR